MLCDAERKDLEQSLRRDEGEQDASSKFPEWPQNVLMALQSEWWSFARMLKGAYGAGRTKSKKEIMRFLCIFLNVSQLLKQEIIINWELNLSK